MDNTDAGNPSPLFPFTRYEPCDYNYKQPWSEFCAGFVLDRLALIGKPFTLQKNGGRGACFWKHTTAPNGRSGKRYITALVVELGVYPPAPSEVLKPEAFAFPFLGHTTYSHHEIRVVIPFAEPLPKSVFTKGERKQLTEWVKRSFSARWACDRTDTICVWSRYPWLNDTREYDAVVSEYACGFRVDGEFATLETLLELTNATKQKVGVR